MGNALKWLTGTATTKDTEEIKKRINELVDTQNRQQETLVHIISIVNITRYETKVNRQRINKLMGALAETNAEVRKLVNFTNDLAASIRYQQILLHTRTMLANLRDGLDYMRHVATHAMDYVDAATTGVLSPDVLPLGDLQRMLQHIEAQLPPTMHLPISSSDTLHFYRYLRTHVLIAENQFLLLIDVPIQDRGQHLQIYEVFNLLIPKGNTSVKYDITTKYLGVTYDETKAVEISQPNFDSCLRENGQFCQINGPLQPLSNPPSCITALYTHSSKEIDAQCALSFSKMPKVFIPIALSPNLWLITTQPNSAVKTLTMICPEKASQIVELHEPFHVLRMPPACSATSKHFHLPPRYEDHPMNINISLDQANLNAINVSTPEFRIWQHIDEDLNDTHLARLSEIPAVPVADLYKKMIDVDGPIRKFSTESDMEDPSPIWNFFTHPGTYIGGLGGFITTGICIYCCVSYWCKPASRKRRSFAQSRRSVLRVDDDVEAAPIYRSAGVVEKLVRPRENHVLSTHLPTPRPESRDKQPVQSKGVPALGSLANPAGILGTRVAQTAGRKA